MMETPTVPFFAFQRTLLATPTDELPAMLDTEVVWPTVDMDAHDLKLEKTRAAQVAIQYPEAGQSPRQEQERWQPPMTADELGHLLDLMRKKWNM